MGVGGGWQAVGAPGVVHEDGQRGVEGERAEGVGAEGLARHGPAAGPDASSVWLPPVVCVVYGPAAALFASLGAPLPRLLFSAASRVVYSAAGGENWF